MIYTGEPENFKDPIDTVGCYVECEGKVLLLRRHPNKSEGGTYCSPGGKVDLEDGSAVNAAIRELFEETGIKANPEDMQFLSMNYLVYPGGTQNFIYQNYKLTLPEFPEVKLSPTEHTEFVWVTPAEALALPLIFDEDICIKKAYGI